MHRSNCFVAIVDDHPFWQVPLGLYSRVAVVFILNRESGFKHLRDVDILVGGSHVRLLSLLNN